MKFLISIKNTKNEILLFSTLIMLTNSLLFSHILEELPYVFVQAVTYGVIVYAMPGFDWTVEKFFWYLFFMYFTLLYFTFYGMMAVGVKPNHHVVSIVAAVFYAIWNLFSGFIVMHDFNGSSPSGGDGTIGHFGDTIQTKSTEDNKLVIDFIEDYFVTKGMVAVTKGLGAFLQFCSPCFVLSSHYYLKQIIKNLSFEIHHTFIKDSLQTGWFCTND
ncbi:hypothetical protein JHK85_039023 [Glycine max]|uniref:ABC-2 type transporter transmembrane domain-containing protein n=1 Tax=Glycine max TaxID=3847 RepID=K7M3W8_SOYBN|nr:hypothetical protein JHK85_039023 [Glycine max]KAH1105188.1 hypothetical protein GYH30_038455 [Glycine max]